MLIKLLDFNTKLPFCKTKLKQKSKYFIYYTFLSFYGNLLPFGIEVFPCKIIQVCWIRKVSSYCNFTVGFGWLSCRSNGQVSSLVSIIWQRASLPLLEIPESFLVQATTHSALFFLWSFTILLKKPCWSKFQAFLLFRYFVISKLFYIVSV